MYRSIVSTVSALRAGVSWSGDPVRAAAAQGCLAQSRRISGTFSVVVRGNITGILHKSDVFAKNVKNLLRELHNNCILCNNLL